MTTEPCWRQASLKYIMDSWLSTMCRSGGRVLLVVLACVMLCTRVTMAATIMTRDDQLDNAVNRDTNVQDQTDGVYTPMEVNLSELYLVNGILINEPYICDNNPFVIIFVHSAPAHTQHRTAIRDSWASVAMDTTFQTKVIFLLGVSSNDITSREILKESETHHDILQFNIEDAYKNLSLKSLAMLQWVEKFCSDVKYVVKVDDDTFVNTPLLINDLHNVVHKNFLMGDIIAGARPIRDQQSKYYTPLQQYRGAMYPTYLSGAAYVISGDVIPALTEAAKTVGLFWLEDIYVTGLLARRARANHIFNGKFGFRIQSIAPCQFSRIIALHRITPVEMKNAWTLLHKEKQDC